MINAICCEAGYDIFLKFCDGGCGGLFDPNTHGNIEGRLFWKPSYENKIYTYIGNKGQGCKYALCMKCSKTKLLS